MDLHYKREALVGSIVLASAAVFVVGTMWLGGKSFGQDNLVPVRFTDIGNVKSSTPVKVSGVPARGSRCASGLGGAVRSLWAGPPSGPGP